MPNSPRFFYNHDGSFLQYVPPPITPDRLLYEAVGCLQGTQVDAVVCLMFTSGDPVPIYRTSLPEAQIVPPAKARSVNVWKRVRNLKAIYAMEPDPWIGIIETAHRNGQQFWANMRVNDGHPTTYGLRSRFGIDHDQYRLGDRCAAQFHDPDPDGIPQECRHWDYSVEAVRQHRLRLIEDVCSKYDLDGFELDFLRDMGHNFTRETVEQGPAILSAFVLAVRELLDRIGKRRGRTIGFSARVPGTLEVCSEMGLDVRKWIKDSLLDVVVPGVYYDTSAELPFDRFVEMARGTSCGVYASVTEGVGPGRFRPPPPEAVRAAALTAWRQGVQGISLFNFHSQKVVNHVDDVRLLSELGDPATLEFANKLYMIAGTAVPCQSRFFAMPYQTSFHHQLPVDVPPQPEGVAVQLPVGDDLARARRYQLLDSLMLRLDLGYVTGDEDLALSINGTEVPLSEARWSVGTQYAFNWNGIHGHLEAAFDLTHGNWIRQGSNEVRLVVKRRPPDIEPNLLWYALRLEIKYNTMPMGWKA